MTDLSPYRREETHFALYSEAKEALEDYLPIRMKYYIRDILECFVTRNDPADIEIPGVENQVRYCIVGVRQHRERIESKEDLQALAGEFEKLREEAQNCLEDYVPGIMPEWADSILSHFVSAGGSWDLLIPGVRQQIEWSMAAIERSVTADLTAEASASRASKSRQRSQLKAKQDRSAAAYNPGRKN